MLLSATKILVYFIIFLIRLAGSWYVCFLYGRSLEVEEIMDEKGEKSKFCWHHSKMQNIELHNTKQ